MPIAVPQGGPIAARRDLGNLAPHPANIGKIMGAKTGIVAPRMHLAKGGISDAENISNNLFTPVQLGGIPNADVNFITSPQLATGNGPPKAQAPSVREQPSGIQQIAEGTTAANGLTSLYNNLPSSSGLIPSSMNPASALGNAGLMAQTSTDAGSAQLMNILGANTAADAATAATTTAGVDAAASTMPEWLTALAALFSEGGAVQGYADGGNVAGVEPITNMLMHREAGETFHPSGLLNSAGPGRTDTINTNVPSGAYVIPADVVSGLGEGNTLAGSAVIDRMFSAAPHGIKSPQIRRGSGAPHPPSSSYANNYLEPQSVDTNFINTVGEGKYAKGGKTHDKAPVVVAGGEHVISPQQIIAKFGSLKRGHHILDHWVVAERERIAKEMLKLAPPVGSKVKKK